MKLAIQHQQENSSHWFSKVGFKNSFLSNIVGQNCLSWWEFVFPKNPFSFGVEIFNVFIWFTHSCRFLLNSKSTLHQTEQYSVNIGPKSSRNKGTKQNKQRHNKYTYHPLVSGQHANSMVFPQRFCKMVRWKIHTIDISRVRLRYKWTHLRH